MSGTTRKVGRHLLMWNSKPYIDDDGGRFDFMFSKTT